MTAIQEAAQRAAEELENCADLLLNFQAPTDSCIGETITSANASADALREALANEPQAEAVAWQVKSSKMSTWGAPITSLKIAQAVAADDGWEMRTLYTHPAPSAEQPGAVGLSEQAIMHALDMARTDAHKQGDRALYLAFGRRMWAQFEAQALAAAQPVAAGWLPIETAPKDLGILLYGAKRLEMCVGMNHSRDGWVTDTTSEWMSMYTPTHWMPLPPPPAATQGAKP